ncbi:MAG: alpha-galactosidase, partial [Bacilli bacterium]
ASPSYALKRRDVVYNNWEATTFDFNESILLDLVNKASLINAQTFVLDDGWFLNRNDDTTSLGDWIIDLKKLPNGLTNIINQAHEKGMKFGLWFEPEMINESSLLYQEHPDWLIKVKNRIPSSARHQFVLDFSNQEVIDHIYKQIIAILDTNQIKYIKWDMNRNISDHGSLSLPLKQQGSLFHLYILGVYQLLERLTNRYPDILFEGCASGGNRFDTGILYYMPQNWTSDNTDPISRLKIQYGTSLVYPLSSMDNNVTDSITNLKRHVSLATRANVAMFGVFGYIFDINNTSDLEINEMKQQVTFYKENWATLQYGRFSRLVSPFETRYCAWQTHNLESGDLLVGIYTLEAIVNDNPLFVKLLDVDIKAYYIDVQSNKCYHGSQLKNIGIRFKVFEESREHYYSTIIKLVKQP